MALNLSLAPSYSELTTAIDELDTARGSYPNQSAEVAAKTAVVMEKMNKCRHELS